VVQPTEEGLIDGKEESSSDSSDNESEYRDVTMSASNIVINGMGPTTTESDPVSKIKGI
jgi:hypothetical protein